MGAQIPTLTTTSPDIRQDPAAGSLILCRDTLVHFSYQHAFAGLKHFHDSGSRYLLTTTFPQTVPGMTMAPSIALARDIPGASEMDGAIDTPGACPGTAGNGRAQPGTAGTGNTEF